MAASGTSIPVAEPGGRKFRTRMNPQTDHATLRLTLTGMVIALSIVGCADSLDAPCTERGAARAAIETGAAPSAVGPYSQAIRAGDTLYLAGQIGLDPDTGALVDGGIEVETRRVMNNLGAVLEAAGFTFSDVATAQVFMADIREFAAMNAVYGDYFGQQPPARATVEVGRLPLDARVEIQLIAVKSSGACTDDS